MTDPEDHVEERGRRRHHNSRKSKKSRSETIVDKAIRRLERVRKRGKIQQDVTEFAMQQWKSLGLNYGGPYPNLKASSVKLEGARNDAEAFAKFAIDPNKATLGPRMVFFADGSVHESRFIGGGGVTFKRFQPDSPQWTDARIAAKGITGSDEAERMALSYALELAKAEYNLSRFNTHPPANPAPTSSPLYIFTDSLETIRKLGKYLAKDPFDQGRMSSEYLHPTFASMIRKLNRLVSNGIQVHFHWTKGHSNGFGNNRADLLAGTAVR